MTFLLIDNYDSFVHNLARYFQQLGVHTQVVRNNRITIEEILDTPPCAIIISPGPCSPSEAGISVDLIHAAKGLVPILGICLGHQAIAQAYGGTIISCSQPVHGSSSWIHHDNSRLFDHIPNPFEAGRYHSLVADPLRLPAEMNVTAKTDEGIIMAIEHRQDLVFGVQFHPESILTPHGSQLLKNFIDIVKTHATSRS